MLALGMDPDTISRRNQSHGTALHHAAWSANLEAVKVLVDAGASLNTRDAIYHGTPQSWAEHAAQESTDETRRRQYLEIAAFLASRSGQ
jgi:ankyrin repeat protein